jgi:beta-galactosidase
MQKQRFTRSWYFHHEEPPVGRRPSWDTADWRLLDLPHDWSIEMDRYPDAPSTTSGGFFPMGTGRYQKKFLAPETWQGMQVLLEFEGVYMNAEVWLNDNFLLRHPYGYTSFTCDLTPYLKLGEENILKVVVDNASQMNSRWYSGSGIYRPVWLWVANPVHIAHWGVYVTSSQVSAQSAVLHAQTRVQNGTAAPVEATLRSRLVDPDGGQAGVVESQITVPAGGDAEFSQDLRVENPQLWSLETPYLYHLESELLLGGHTVDTASTTCGVRSLDFSPEQGFRLNGLPIKLKGGCVHHDNGILGAASYERSEERKVALHKASGFNAIRCAHNPPAPAFLDACDRLGMLVIDEAFDCWREGKNPYDYHVVFSDWWQRDVDSMLLRDRNHPSIILWSIGNELIERDGRSDGVGVAHALAERVHSLDATRPVIAAICGSWDPTPVPWSKMDGVFAELGVGGYNYQWEQYQPDHDIHPQRMMIGTESFPIQAFENWQSVLAHDYVLGDFVWTSLDYLGESGIGRVHYDGEEAPFLGAYPWHQANCGDLDLCGFKRPQSYYRDILWEHGEPLYIAVHDPIPEEKIPTITRWGWPLVWPNWNWPGREGEIFQVDVYSACEQVELFLNGRSLGVQPTTLEQRRMASFEAPYEPGELKAVGYTGGKPAAEYLLKTAGAPACLRLVPDRSEIRAEGGDLCFVTAEVLDAHGQVHPTAEDNLLFSVKGPGSLLAVGSSNPVSEERYVGNQRRAYRGRCLVAIKPSGEPGEIRLRAQADGLDGDEIVLKAV